MEERITIAEAAARMHCGLQFVRIALQRGRYEWGIAEKMPGSSQYTYYINKAMFEKWLKGERNGHSA